MRRNLSGNFSIFLKYLEYPNDIIKQYMALIFEPTNNQKFNLINLII